MIIVDTVHSNLKVNISELTPSKKTKYKCMISFI